ncbi:ATRER1A [Dunaliella salina]|uniref:Protein RER1 n=1 Tax=Dunaliella salina TaxID=3046 RepID=A0ABQ7H8N7_DUNSA|nr:ATRER1A [Dunaliella salina]|eukprot:KAF5843222.1 ATRER1A [Dunaliella salina]
MEEPPSTLSTLQAKANQRLQWYLDKSSPHVLYRWLGLLAVALIYIIRVWYLRGFYVVTYGIAIFDLNLLLGFLTPQADPESEGPQLPTNETEFRPFVRRLPEFKFWYAALKSFLIGIVLTFFSIFDVPVFWPILLLYFCILFFVTMKRQIKHMIKYRYIPLTWGKKKYGGKSSGSRQSDRGS